jgi:hypothetical protein
MSRSRPGVAAAGMEFTDPHAAEQLLAEMGEKEQQPALAAEFGTTLRLNQVRHSLDNMIIPGRYRAPICPRFVLDRLFLVTPPCPDGQRRASGEGRSLANSRVWVRVARAMDCRVLQRRASKEPAVDFRLVTERRSSSGGWESAVPQMGSVGPPVRAVCWQIREASWASFTNRASREADRWGIEGGLCKQLGRARVGSHLGHA